MTITIRRRADGIKSLGFEPVGLGPHNVTSQVSLAITYQWRVTIMIMITQRQSDSESDREAPGRRAESARPSLIMMIRTAHRTQNVKVGYQYFDSKQWSRRRLLSVYFRSHD